MGRIIVGFEGLCLLFTNNLKRNAEENSPAPSLTVGLVEVNAKTKEKLPEFVEITQDDRHYPQITINEIQVGDEETIRERQFCSMVAGDLSLENYFATSGIAIKETTEEDPSVELSTRLYNNDGAAIPDPFKIIRIAEDLYPVGSELRAKPELCKARLHIKAGTLYSRDPRPIKYGASDIEGNHIGEGSPQEKTASIKAGMEIAVTDDGYALLYFGDGRSAFRFEGEKDYEVVVTSLSKRSHSEIGGDRNHFLYYYSVFSPLPSELIAPIDVDQQDPFNNPFCSVIGAGGGGG